MMCYLIKEKREENGKVHEKKEKKAAVRGSCCVLAGGVAANKCLRNRLQEKCDSEGVRFYYPDIILCTDNAAMIGCRAYYQWQSGDMADLSLNAVPSLPLGGKLHNQFVDR